MYGVGGEVGVNVVQSNLSMWRCTRARPLPPPRVQYGYTVSTNACSTRVGKLKFYLLFRLHLFSEYAYLLDDREQYIIHHLRVDRVVGRGVWGINK